MAYKITLEQLRSISDPEVAFSTDRLLPKWVDIPEEFRRGNLYTRLAESLMFGRPLPDMAIEFREGFPEAEGKGLIHRCVAAHLKSHGPKHEHKIAGVGFMISKVMELVPPAPTIESLEAGEPA